MNRPALLVVAALVVVSGCSATPGFGTNAPSSTASPSAESTTIQPTTASPTTARPTDTGVPTTTDRTGVDRLSFDPNVTFDRLERLFDVNVEQPTIQVRDEPDYGQPSDGGRYVLETFGVASRLPEDRLPVSGSATGPRVSIGFADASPVVVEGVLAHELFHSIQVQTGMLPNGSVDSFDERMATNAIIEGGATYAATTYVERYDVGDRNWTALYGQQYHRGPDGVRYAASMYHFGARYYHAKLSDPANVQQVTAEPPGTTEAVLHPDRNVSRPESLSVTANASDEWSAGTSNRYGELFTRVVLRSELSSDRASRAADGWENDALVRFERSGDRGVAWVHQWKTSEDAAEFADAFSAYREHRQDDTDAEFRLVRVNETTTALFAGNRTFVDDAAVALADGVRISAGS